jgi:hypothetical protein
MLLKSVTRSNICLVDLKLVSLCCAFLKVVILNYTYHALLNLYDVNICSSDIGVNLQIYSNYLSRILRQGCMVQEKQNFSSVKIISVSLRKRRWKLSRPAEINLTSVGRRQADGSYGDNFHRLGKPTKVRRLNPIMRTRPVPASTPTLRSITVAAPSSNPYRPPAGSSTPPPPLQPAPPRAPPHPDRLVALACCRPRLSLSLSLSLMGLTCTPPSPTLGLPSYPPPPGRCPTPTPLPRPPAPTPSADTVDHRLARLGLPRPAPDPPAAACLPWPLVHLTLSTGQPLMPPASLSRRIAPQPPNSSRRLWTSPARPPPLDATSHLGPPPPVAIGRPPRALVRYSSPYCCK